MQHADLERNAEQQIEPDRGADHLGEIGGADRDLGQQPQRHRTRARKRVAAGLREVAPGGDAEPRAQRLQQDRHHVGQQRDGQQRVAELASRRRARSPNCRGPCSRPRPDSRARERRAACATTDRSGASGSSRTLRPATACRRRGASLGRARPPARPRRERRNRRSWPGSASPRLSHIDVPEILTRQSSPSPRRKPGSRSLPLSLVSAPPRRKPGSRSNRLGVLCPGFPLAPEWRNTKRAARKAGAISASTSEPAGPGTDFPLWKRPSVGASQPDI